MTSDLRRLRLLFLITSLEQGGAEQVLFDTVTALDPKKYDVGIVAMRGRGPYFQKLRALGVTVESLDIRRKFAPGAFLRLCLRIQNFRPDVIHAHLFHADIPTRIASWLCRLKPRPVFISHQHIPDPRPLKWRHWLEKTSARWVDAFVCVSEAVAAHIREFHELDSKKVRVIANGRDLAPFKAVAELSDQARAELRSQLFPNIPADAWLLGSVGRLDPQKDQRLLLEALALVEVPVEVHTVFAGSGELLKELTEFSAELGLTERVHWLGRRSDVPELLACMDVFVLSSKYEGLPIAAIEAMAAKRPILATDVPGIHDVLEGGAGELVPYRDPEALARAVEALMSDPERRDELAQRGYDKALGAYSRDRMVTDFEALYVELLSERGARL